MNICDSIRQKYTITVRIPWCRVTAIWKGIMTKWHCSYHLRNFLFLPDAFPNNSELGHMFFLSPTPSRDRILLQRILNRDTKNRKNRTNMSMHAYYSAECKYSLSLNKKPVEKTHFKAVIMISVSKKMSSTLWNCKIH